MSDDYKAKGFHSKSEMKRVEASEPKELGPVGEEMRSIMECAEQAVRERDLATKAMNAAHESLRKAGEEYKAKHEAFEAMRKDRDEMQKAGQDLHEQALGMAEKANKARDAAIAELDNKRGAMLLEIHRLKKESDELRSCVKQSEILINTFRARAEALKLGFDSNRRLVKELAIELTAVRKKLALAREALEQIEDNPCVGIEHDGSSEHWAREVLKQLE